MEILSWSWLMQVQISPWEVHLLRQIDRKFRVWHATKDEPEPNVDSGTPIADSLRMVAEARKKQNG